MTTEAKTVAAAALAAAFSKVIRSWLTPEQLAEVNRRNKVEEPCYSHTYCDANQAMIDAMESLGLEFDGTDFTITLVNEAWELAIKADYSL
jgi:hypothetical protein